MVSSPADVVAEGQLVVLRRKRLEDAQQDWIWRTDTELAELDASPVSHLTYDQFRNQFEWQLRTTPMHRSTFAVETIDDPRHIGNVMYYNTDFQRRETELGIVLGDRTTWNGGYGRETVRLLIDYVFTHTALTRIYLHTLDWNVRAQRAFSAAGFRDCGRVRRGRNRFHQMHVLREWFWDRDYQRRGISSSRAQQR